MSPRDYIEQSNATQKRMSYSGDVPTHVKEQAIRDVERYVVRISGCAGATMTTRSATEVLAYYEYVHWSQSPKGTRYFCSECYRGISGIYGLNYAGFPEYPEDLERREQYPGEPWEE